MIGFKHALGAAALAAGLWASSASAETLRVLAWEGYADPDWVKDFTKETGIDVDVVFIGSDDEIWAKIKGSEGKDFDVMAVNTAQLQRYIDADLVKPWDLSKIPNQKDVLPRFRDLSAIKGMTRDGKVYGIPFCFDSIGLIYDTDKVKPAPTSMTVLWDPQYQGKVLAYDNGEHNFSFTALTEGIENPFHLTDEQFAKIKDKLVDLKRNTLSFYTTADEAMQIYQNNDVALIWANYGQQQVKALQKVGGELSERTGFGNTVTETDSANPNDKLVWLQLVEDPLKRSDMWNEVKAAP